MHPVDYDELIPRGLGNQQQAALSWLSKQQKSTRHELSFLTEEYDLLSRSLDASELQSASSVRNVLLTRKIAVYLIDDKGFVVSERLGNVRQALRQNLYPLGPGRCADAEKQEHIAKILTLLAEDKEYGQLLHKLGKPHQNAVAERLVRHTLHLPENHVVTDACVRRAGLSAALCYLRQSVGSCFATAPCILLHQEQPKQFLRDLAEIINMGVLKRTFGGVEYAAPLSVSWGAGDLKRQVYLRQNLEESTPPVWLSPGLINALVSTEVIAPEISLEQKRTQLKEKILTLGLPQCVILVEELLEELLLFHFGVTREEVEVEESRVSPMVSGALLVQSGVGSKKIEAYKKARRKARAAFKLLADNALLKAWEFTVATYTETKANFSSWNLYSSLGFRADEPGGLGERLWGTLSELLSRENSKIEEFQGKYEQTYSQVRYMEGRFKRARDDKEARWLRSELQGVVQEMTTWETLRDKAKFRAESFANLFDVLVHEYMALFPQYFQEVYDAEMRDVTVQLYDDTPAGFQLIYKHGRSAHSTWSSVKSLSEYVDALVAFFSSTEHEIVHNPVMEGFEAEVSEIVGSFIAHVKTEEFLESALVRMARARGGRLPEKPLENIHLVEKKPWSYTSGGSMETLLQCYFKLEEQPTVVDRWVESPIELLVFVTDQMRALESATQEEFCTEPGKRLLITSPTHAFTFLPCLKPFCEGWQRLDYTYTWCRDAWVIPRVRFAEQISLDVEMIRILFASLRKTVPAGKKVLFDEVFASPPRRLSPKEFRSYCLQEGKGLFSGKGLDRFLYEMLPFTRSYKIEEIAEGLFARFLGGERCLEVFNELSKRLIKESVVPANHLRDLIHASLLLGTGKAFVETNLCALADDALQESGALFPAPLAFADTNWVDLRFGFVVNPGTGELELWAVSPTGATGMPMPEWNCWLNGERKSPRWEVYTRPHQYLV